jgi:hypothetical protein
MGRSAIAEDMSAVGKVFGPGKTGEKTGILPVAVSLGLASFRFISLGFAWRWARPICESHPNPSSGRKSQKWGKSGAKTCKSSASARICPHRPHLPALFLARRVFEFADETSQTSLPVPTSRVTLSRV